MRIQHTAKKHALSRGMLGCLGEVATLNVARGCAGRCAFCYARCVPGVPADSDQLLLYNELPDLLRQSLERRRRPPPRFVLLSTASDPFLGGEQVLQVTRGCIEVLLERRIGITLSTRGEIPDDVIELLARRPRQVRVTVPLVSLSDDYTRSWEPGTASPRARLFLLQRLHRAGITGVQLRLDPLIPFVNDDTDGLRQVISAAVGLGQTSATLNFLHLRPGVAEQLQREAPDQMGPLVLGGFQPGDPDLEPPGGRFQHLPLRHRQAGLRRIQRLARSHGLRVSACSCQNPGIPSRRCPVQPPELPVGVGTQLSLLE